MTLRRKLDCYRSCISQPEARTFSTASLCMSCPLYSTIRVVTSVVRSDHNAVVAYAVQPKFAAKTTTTKTFRPISPSQHAQFLYYISTFVFPEIGLTTPRNVQTEFGVFYDTALRLLNHFIRSIPSQLHLGTILLLPHYITPHIKANAAQEESANASWPDREGQCSCFENRERHCQPQPDPSKSHQL